MQSFIPRKLLGDARQELQKLPEQSVHVFVTSPPYHGMRSYLPDGHEAKQFEIGNEPTFELYLEHIPRAPLPCTVGDPFHGSGSTASAASSLGRQYVGCELNPEYFKLSDARDGQGALAIV